MKTKARDMDAKMLLFAYTLYFFNSVVPSVQGTTCEEMLVSGKNPIPNSAITASSTWGPMDRMHFPQRSRINMVLDGNGNGAWSALENNDKQWLQFDLGFPRQIIGVVTKGRQGYVHGPQYVTAYRLQYGNMTDDMNVYVDHDYQPMVFDGNWDTLTPQVRLLDKSIYARYIRINPVKWNQHVSMRADLLGCPLTMPQDPTIIG